MDEDDIEHQLTCASWLPLVERHLPTELATADARFRLKKIAGKLPGDCLTALEVRLAADGHQVDLSLRLGGLEDAAALVERYPVPRLEAFLARGARRASDLDPLGSLWLEFDLDRSPQGLLDPVICVELCEPVEKDWLLEVLIPTLVGNRPSACQRRLIHGCLGAVTAASGRLLYVFDLGSRTESGIRLELQSPEPAAIAQGLRTVVPEELCQRLIDMSGLLRGCDDYHLSMDVNEGLSSRVGLEASYRRLPHQEPGWEQLLDRLVGHDLCTLEKRAAILAWPGWDSPRTASDVWPVAARRPGKFCARCLSHIKLVSHPERPLEAKAYLLFQPLDKRPASGESLSSSTNS